MSRQLKLLPRYFSTKLRVKRSFTKRYKLEFFINKKFRVFLGYYFFFFFFFSCFFIVYVWSIASKFSTIFYWNGDRFTLREDATKNYNMFNNSGEVYECGFSGVEEPLKKIEIQYLILAIFFIIYEIEFLLLLPFFMYIEFLSLFSFTIILVSFLLIMFSY